MLIKIRQEPFEQLPTASRWSKEGVITALGGATDQACGLMLQGPVKGSPG